MKRVLLRGSTDQNLAISKPIERPAGRRVVMNGRDGGDKSQPGVAHFMSYG